MGKALSCYHVVVGQAHHGSRLEIVFANPVFQRCYSGAPATRGEQSGGQCRNEG